MTGREPPPDDRTALALLRKSRLDSAAPLALLRRALSVAVGVGLLLRLLAVPASAHAGGLEAARAVVPVPFWLVVLTGGGVIAGSFLFTTLVTDHETIRAVNDRYLGLPSAGRGPGWGGRALGAVGVVGLVLVAGTGLLPPHDPAVDFAVLVVWAGWWAGYTMSVYLVGNSWPLVNPWRRIAALVPAVDRPYPARLGAWPAVAGLLGLVYVEVVTPVASRPRLLTAAVLGYTVVTLAGATVYGRETWFGVVDPIARVFRYYGLVAPVQWTDQGPELRLPAAALTGVESPLPADETAFVVALLWATTFDGLVSTPAWGGVVRRLVGLGAPAPLVYAAALLAGFGLFLGIYRLAAARARRTADSYVTPRYLGGWFALSLLPIAAGYHLAHYLGYFLSLTPALVAVTLQPFGPGAVPVLSLPGWIGASRLVFVLVGHVVAVWVAHALAFDLFTGRLQPVRSQYPFILAMVFYTMTSMWIVAQPYAAPPFV